MQSVQDLINTPEQLLRLEIRFEEVLGRYAEQRYHWPLLELILLSRFVEPQNPANSQKQMLGLQLSARFFAEEIPALVEVFPAMAAYENGYLDYRFQMKAMVFERYTADFARIQQPHQILEIGQLACLDLQHYDCLGLAKNLQQS